MNNLKSGIYQHYKGDNCKIWFTAIHSETLEEMVVYQDLTDSKDFGKNAFWVRPLKMFLEEVEKDGKKIPRFKFISQD